MIESIILIAALTNGIIINPVYQYLLKKFKLDFKPFNCLYCLSFHLGWIVSLLFFNATALLILPFAASFTASLMERLYNSLPTIIN